MRGSDIRAMRGKRRTETDRDSGGGVRRETHNREPRQKDIINTQGSDIKVKTWVHSNNNEQQQWRAMGIIIGGCIKHFASIVPPFCRFLADSSNDQRSSGKIGQ